MTSFWNSTHSTNWTSKLSASTLRSANHDDHAHFSDTELRSLNSYLIQSAVDLGAKLGLRQQVIATCIVLFKRFYLRSSFTNFHPVLIILTVTYISSKVEECQIQPDRILQSFYALNSQSAPKFTEHNVLECKLAVSCTAYSDLHANTKASGMSCNGYILI
jgi:cyclin C